MENLKKSFLKDINDISIKKKLKEYDAFVFWYLKTTENLSEEEIIETITNKSKDFGVDAIIIDKEFKVIKIIQSKYTENIGQSCFDKDEINKLYMVYYYLTGQEDYTKIKGYVNKLLKEKIENSIKKIKDEGYSVKLVFVTTHKENPNYQVYSKEDVPLEVISSKDIERRYEEWRHGHTPELGEIKMNFSSIMESPLSDPKAYLANFDVCELFEKYQTYKDKLFSRNVRIFYGDTNKPNKAMKMTLLSKRAQDFWYFNNGITILSEKVKINHENKIISLLNPQIINGCQTVSTIGITDQIVPGKSFLFAKIIEIGDNILNQDIIDGIVEANNRQTPVDERMLKSNHPLQVKLQRDLEQLNFYYERKERQYNEERSRFNRVKKLEKIDNKFLLMANLALVKQPNIILEKEDELFSVYFSEVFKEGKNHLDYLIPYLMWREIKKIGKHYRGDNRRDFHNWAVGHVLRIIYDNCPNLKNNIKMKIIYMKLERVEPYDHFKFNDSVVKKILDLAFIKFSKWERKESGSAQRDFFKKKDTYKVVSNSLTRDLRKQINELLD